MNPLAPSPWLDPFGTMIRGLVAYVRWQMGEPLRRRAWRAAARSHGMTEVAIHSGLAVRGSLSGRCGAFRVRLESASRSLDDIGTRISVEPIEGRLPAVRLRGLDAPGEPEIEIGDGAFDATFHIGGSPALVLAFLDAETRRTLGRLVAQLAPRRIFVEMADGALRAYLMEAHAADMDRDVALTLGILLQTAEHLAPVTDAPARLAQNAAQDPQPGVRLQNLLVLLREFAEHPATAPTLRAACLDDSREIRLRAASALGVDGYDVLHGLIEDAAADDTTVARALYALGGHLPADRANAILEGALRTRRLGTALACLERLGHSGPDAVGMLAKVALVESGELAVGAARALGSVGGAEAERRLLELLESDRGVPGLAFAAAEALGRFGSAAAVAALKEAADRSSDRALRGAARQAVAEIQARLTAASPGQLSLSGADAGQLSIAPQEAGQVSVATGDGGEVSLPDDSRGRLSGA